MPSNVGMDPPKDPVVKKTPCLACLDVFDKGWPSSAGKWTLKAEVENPWTRHLLTSFILFVSLQKQVFVSSCLIFPDPSYYHKRE